MEDADDSNVSPIDSLKMLRVGDSNLSRCCMTLMNGILPGISIMLTKCIVNNELAKFSTAPGTGFGHTFQFVCDCAAFLFRAPDHARQTPFNGPGEFVAHFVKEPARQGAIGDRRHVAASAKPQIRAGPDKSVGVGDDDP
jgi:hypothetical protein